MTLGDRHLSDPPGTLYSNPFCLSPSYDPTTLDPFHGDPSPKAPSSPMNIHDHPRGTHLSGSAMLHSHHQLHAGERPHTVHGAASEMLRYIDPCHSPYDQLFPFTDDMAQPSMRGASPPSHAPTRGASPPSNGLNTSTVGPPAPQYPHPQSHVYGTGGPQRTSSDTSLPSGLDAPLDMAFLDIPSGSPTHSTPPWTPQSSHAFNDTEDPLMQPLPQLDGPLHPLADLAFQQQPLAEMRPPQQAPLRRLQPQQAQQQQFIGKPLPRAGSNAGSVSGLRDESALHHRTHSPALSDAGMSAAAFSEAANAAAGRTTSGHMSGQVSGQMSGHISEQRSMSNLQGLPHRSGADEATAMSDMHVQDAFGSAFAMQPTELPRAEVSGLSRESSLRLLHSSITGQQTGGDRGSFHPVCLNSYSHWGMQPPSDLGSAHGRRAGNTHSGGQLPPTDMFASAQHAPPQQPQPAHIDVFSAAKDGNLAARRIRERGDAPPRWQQQQGGGGMGMAADGSLGGRHPAGVPQQLQMAAAFPGPQMMYGVPQQPGNSFNAMYIGVQPAFIDHSSGGAAGMPATSAFPQEHVVQGDAGGPQVMPGTNGRAVHESTQRGGTAMRKLQNVPEDAVRPVMLRAAPTGRTGPRRSGGGGSSVEGRTKRSAAVTLSEMVAKADAVAGPAGEASLLADTSLHSSSKRTRTSNGTALHPNDTPSIAGGRSASLHTNLTGQMDAFGMSDAGGGSTHSRSRRSRLGLDPKDEWSLEDWVARIAREEAAGSADVAEVALREEFLDWETRSKSAPNGKWRGANSRKWGKVGIEMRLTGSVPRTAGPVTQLGRMVCKFVDVVEAEGGAAAPSPARPLGPNGTQATTPRGADAAAAEEKQVSGHSGQESAVGGMGAILDDTVSMHGAPSALEGSQGLPDGSYWRTAGRTSGTLHRSAALRASGRSFSAMQAMEGDEKYVWRLAEIVDKQVGGVKTVLKEKVWLGTYHTPINAAVHHDFYKVVLAVEGCIFTSVDVPTCSAPTGKKKSQKLKLNFPLDDLPELMYKAVRFTQLWNKYKQDAERYVFRSFDAGSVRALVQDLIDKHCLELRKHVANNDPEGTANTVERRSTRTRATITTQRSAETPGDLPLD
eukprot:jgi/Ulvmu1/11134/UM071_0017.1